MLTVLASLDSILNIAKSFLGIGAIIFVHELGHFLVGRWCGVKAEAFSIGFGPVIAKWQPGETEYRLSAVPLGGYVKFLGENPDERGELDPRSFHAATYPRKVMIMLAGVTMNVIAAFALFAVTFSVGWEAKAPIVGAVVPGMPAWEYGIEKGDEIVEIDGHRIIDFTDIPQETAFVNEVGIVLRRGETLLPPLRIPTRDRGEGLRQIGIGPAAVEDGRFAVIDGDAPDSASAGFRTDDRVVAVDGSPVTSFQAARAAHEAAKRDTVWTVERDGAPIDVTLPWKTRVVPRIGVLLGSRRVAVRRNAPAFAAGLRTGDEPLRVGAIVTPTSNAFVAALADAGNPGPAVVLRDGNEITVTLPESAARTEFALSVAPLDAPGEVWATLREGDGAARSAGLPAVFHVREIDGDAVQGTTDFQQAVQAAGQAGRSLSIGFTGLMGAEGVGASGEILVTPASVDLETDFGGLTPIMRTRLVKEPNLVAAMGLGLNRTHRWVMRIFDTLRSIVTGRVSGTKLSGPIGIAMGTYSQAKSSWGDFLLFLGMISMNLAVLNVLPIPLLDGGQLAVVTIEKVRGKPLPERVLASVQWTGLVLLLALMVYVIKNDIVNLL